MHCPCTNDHDLCDLLYCYLGSKNVVKISLGLSDLLLLLYAYLNCYVIICDLSYSMLIRLFDQLGPC